MPMIIEQDEPALEPIAIVGMACHLPGSVDSPSKFWETLREKKTLRTPRVPKERFDIDAHYHPDLGRPGSFSALGGYFLADDPVDFDPSFFHMTPIEAQWLDPQQRKMLEICYEVLENAGVPLERAAGSNTGVYVASFTSDYQQMSIFERDFRHNYAATGVDPGIISNRINNAFNLNGPSCIINTACSSSVYGIHNACHALRTGDCDAAIAAGSNLVMIVDQHMNTAKLGVLSPTSECHTFDERADGYGRAEGIGALYLKRLSDAIKDKDVIRGIIRSSAVNTNGKVEGMGITFPNALGQEKVLRHAYKRANLDPNQTAYLECHGTGTPTGDPIECRAVSLGMNDSRSTDKPLLLGAAKANIGHSEAASGIFAAMKAALMTEKGEIPGVYGFQTLNPNIKDKEWNIEIVRELRPWPAGFAMRRASVSSFGYGGTNAHLVIEAADHLCPWYSHGQPKATASYDYDDAAPRPLLVAMSAHDAPTLRRNIAAHQAIAADYHLTDLAYTLNCRRTQFTGARGYAIVAPGRETEALSPDGFAYGAALPRPANVGFVFTGQGAQWARMGAEALTTFPRFAETVSALDRVLQLIEPRPAWSLREVLEAPAASSRVGEPEIAQPVCTAIQIAIVDLFASWGIEPTVTVGHSSGEIAAAYAAGRLSAPEAMLAAYFRGYAVARAAPAGAMLAVGLGADQVPEYLAKLPADTAARLTIACENSPASVTMSGSDVDVQALKRVLDDSGVFARALKTGKAYHSSQMDSVAPMYAELYAAAHETLSETQLVWRRPVVGMVSSVTGAVVQATELPITYWCDNLRSRVLFDRALTTLGATPDFANVNILVEIGPHTALGGPVKQIVAAREYDMQYVASLTRDTDGAVALLRTAGELFNRGLEVAFDQINSLEATPMTGMMTVETAKGRARNGPRYLPDLPHYQWNYERRHWWQPRVMKELRESKHPRHDVLGRRIFGLSDDAATWKNVLRQRDVAWFADHTLGQDVVFPAAGHVSLAVEALLQLLDLEPADMAGAGVALRDIRIQTALIVPETDDGVEVHTRLERLEGPGDWYAFTVESVAAAADDASSSDGGDKDVWTRHSTGKIRARPRETPNEAPACPVPLSQLHQQASGTRWYKSFRRVGFRYGPSMQTLTHVRANGRDRVTASGVKVQTTCDAVPHESRYLLHPATIDGCLHAVIAAVHRGRHKEMPWGVIPLEIAEMALRFPASDDVAGEGRCTAWADRAWDRYFAGGLQLFGGASGKCLMDIRGWKFITYDAVLPPQMTAPAPREPYRVVRWQAADEAAQASLATKASGNGNVAVVHASRDSPLARALGATPIPVSRNSVHELDKVVMVDSDGSGTSTPMIDDVNNFERIVVDDADGSLLAGALNDETWDALRNILQSHKPVVWVTRGAHAGRCVDAGLPQGFLRAVRAETMAPSVALVDADDEASLEKLAGLVQHELGAMAAPTPGVDVECWLTRDARVLVPRLETHDKLNKLLHQAPEAEVAALPSEGAWQGKMAENEVVFEATTAPAALGPDDVELRVSFAELTRDDLAPRAPVRARLITGTVMRTGSNVDTRLCGRAVAAVTRAPPLATRVMTSVFAPLPAAGTTPAAAAHALPPLVRAVDATRAAGPDDHILLLPGAPRPFERAVAQLGAHIGFRVSRVPKGTVDVAPLLQSATDDDDPNSRPPIVVAAATGGSSSSPLVPEVWRVLPRGAQLVLSDVPVDQSMDMRPLARGARLRVCGVAEGLDNDPAALREVLGRAVEMLEKIAPTPGPVLSVEELCDLDHAREAMTETGADVLSMKYGESKVKIRKPHEPVRFSPEAAYLLVGCLGGLGRSLTTWMLERGCRHFVFLSRSGTAKPEAADVVRRLEDAGAKVQVCCVDACDEEAVAGVVTKVASQQPIKGVVHAAMVLQDGLYETMTLPAYRAALGPKRQAALVLDKALGKMPLDFFVMTSSISAVLGNPGQANYAAGNSFLDHLALARRRRGLAACSLALPLVEDVGVVAENEALAAALARKMPFGVDEREMLRGFEAAIRHGAAAPPSSSSAPGPTLGDAQLVLGLEPVAMRDALDGRPLDDSFWFHDARMAPVRAELERLTAEAGAASKAPGGGGDFAASLAGLGEDEALEAIGRHIAARAARILGAPAEGFALEGASVASHGIDSMIGVELQSWLFKEFGLQLSVQVLSHPKTTFAGLARTTAQQMGILAV